MATTEQILNEISNNVYGQEDWKQLIKFFIDKQLPETAISFIEEVIERIENDKKQEATIRNPCKFCNKIHLDYACNEQIKTIKWQ